MPNRIETRAAIFNARETWKKEINTVTICQRPKPGEIAFEYRWGDNLGNWYSPPFDNVMSAMKFPLNNPLQICGSIRDEVPTPVEE